MTPENKEEIKKVIKEHFDTFDLLKVEDIDVRDKAQLLYDELPNVYKKLDEAKLLPEGMTWEIFLQVVVPHLNAHLQRAFIRQQYFI